MTTGERRRLLLRRFVVDLARPQYDALRGEAARLGIPATRIVRRALQAWLARPASDRDRVS